MQHGPGPRFRFEQVIRDHAPGEHDPSVAGRYVFYNNSAFDAARLAHPNTNWTADDFLSAAKQLTSGEGGAKRYGYASLGAQTEDLRFFMSLLGAPVTHDGAPNFTDPKVEQAARFYIDLLKNYSPHKQIQGYTRDLAFGGDAFKLIESKLSNL